MPASQGCRQLSPTLLRPEAGKRSCLALTLTAAFLLWSAPATAALQDVGFEIAQDGTPGFDGADGPGLDSGANNGIVRTNDEVQYRVTLRSSGPDDDIRLRIDLPPSGGAEPLARWSVQLPPGCGSASSISADRQQIDCRVQDFTSAGTQTLLLSATVSSSNAHGSTLPSPTLRVSSRKTASLSPARVPAALRISAAPFYTIRLQNSYQGVPRAHGFQADGGPNGEAGFYHRHLIGLLAQNPHGHGIKGVERLSTNTPIEIELDLSGYRPSVRPIDWRTAGNTPNTRNRPTGSFGDGCGSPGPGGAVSGSPGELSGSHINMHDRVTDSGPTSSTDRSSVANGGDCRLVHADRGTIRLNLTQVDSSLAHRPVVNWGTGNPLPTDEAWIANKALVLWTALSDYPVDQPITNTISLRRVQARSISDQSLQIQRSLAESLSDPNMHSSYTAENKEQSLILTGFTPSDGMAFPLGVQADPNVTGNRLINQMAPGQITGVFLRYNNAGTVGQSNAELCSKLDRTAFDLSSYFEVGLYGRRGVVDYGAPAAGTSPYFTSTDSAPDPYIKQSPDGHSAYTEARCDDPGIRWFNNWRDAEAAGGLVYVRIRQPNLPGGTSFSATIRGLQLRETWAATIAVETPTASTRQAGQPIEDGTILRTQMFVRSDSLTYQNSVDTRDHLQVVPTQTTTRISQRINGQTSSSPIRVSANSHLDVELTPSYSTYYPPIDGIVTVDAVLPAGLRYVRGSARMGTTPVEPEILTNDPANGQYTLRWRYPAAKPHVGDSTDAQALLPAISYRAQVGRTLADGSLLPINARVNGGAYDHQADCTFNAGNSSFNGCVKSARSELTIQTPAGFVQEKEAIRDIITAGDNFGYRIKAASMGENVSAPHIPDMIDILPFVGDGQQNAAREFVARSPASSFSAGAYRLQSVRITGEIDDPDARIYFTRRTPGEIHGDPRHDSNRMPGGETRWCLATEFGQADCPAHIGESTAVRISPTVQTLPSNQTYEVTLELQSDPVRSHEGNVFANRVSMRPATTASPLLLTHSQDGTQVRISGKLGGIAGRVFTDHDQDNVVDADDYPLVNQCIRLDGITSNGQSFTLSMRTDASGEFAFNPDQKDRVFISADCSGTAMAQFHGLPVGEYTLSKIQTADRHRPGLAHAGTLGGSISNQTISGIRLTDAGIGTAYHFTEQRALAQLTLSTTVNNDHGGSAQADAIELHATAEGSSTPSIQGTSGSSSASRVSVPAGRYQLGSIPPRGYRAEAWQCRINDQAAVSGNLLTLQDGDKAVCTIVHDDQPARLSLATTVTNSNGRTARPEDFTLQATGTSSSIAGPSGASAITEAPLPAGEYRLTASSLAGYVAGTWLCRDQDNLTGSVPLVDGHGLSLAVGDQIRCEISHTDQPVSLTLLMEVINQYGGKASASEHELRASGPVSISGISGAEAVTVAPVPPGHYRLDVPVLPGYATEGWACAPGELDDNVLTLSDQQNVRCHIIYRDQPAQIEVSQSVEGEAQPVADTDSDFLVSYAIRVVHTGGAAGRFDLLGMPAFDPDVQLLSASLLHNGQSLPLQLDAQGRWPLVTDQSIGIDEEMRYQLQLRIRVPFGSNQENNRCVAGAEGRGLFHRLMLNNHSSDAGDGAVQQASACIDTPTPKSSTSLSIEKSATQKTAEIGDLVQYRLRVRNTGNAAALTPVIVDTLPRGFRLDERSLRIDGASMVSMQQHGRQLRITLDRIAPTGASPAAQMGTALLQSTTASSDAEVSIHYRVRLGVGSQEGDGINRAHVECLATDGSRTTRCSNESRWQLRIEAGVFSEEACLAGQIFVDCNGNSIKDTHELGIPGVRVYLQNGTWLVSDAHGKFSHCGLRPRTHVLKIDTRTLPHRARLVTSSAQNAGDAHSLFIDAKKGMLHRADFIEGSCSAQVLGQVKARQSAAEQPQQNGRSTVFDSARRLN